MAIFHKLFVPVTHQDADMPIAYLWHRSSRPDVLNMEENRTQLRLSARRLIAIIYLLVIGIAIAAYFLINDLEQSGVVRDTQTERGWATLLLLLVWTMVCYRLYRNNMRIFDLRSQIFDARETEHYAVKEAARLREQFMANMSHEIRTPLNAIIGFGNLLARADLPERERELATNIQVSGETLLALVNDILDLSKIEAGALVLEHVPFEVGGLFHSVQQMFSEKARQKNLSLDIQLAPGLPEELTGDPTRLTQILANLIGNALKFTERGGVLVSVVPVESGDKERITIRIEVRDSGIGIPKNQLERVFERFTQSDEQTTRNYGGTGLGLSIVRQLVQAMQGSVSVQSELGKGSVFTVLLPFDRKPAEAPAQSSAARTETPVPRDIRLLVAEDNPMNRRVVELLFDEWKFPYTMVHNGREAVELLGKDPNAFDLVLMDIQMPELDGYEATRQIRQKLGLRIPIVAMTAHALPGEREKCLSFGMNEYLAKPVREQELLDLIARFVPQTDRSAEPEIDRGYLHETTRGNATYLRELANIFVAQAPKDLEAISSALAANDLTAAARAAHNMKSTVGYMGFAHNLGRQLARFEQQCAEGANTEALQQSFGQIRTAVGSATTKVQRELL